MPLECRKAARWLGWKFLGLESWVGLRLQGALWRGRRWLRAASLLGRLSYLGPQSLLEQRLCLTAECWATEPRSLAQQSGIRKDRSCYPKEYEGSSGLD